MSPAPQRIFPLLTNRNREYSDTLRLHGQCALIVGLPWEMITPHTKQAFRNHSQDLAQLAERGGLSAVEALAVLRDQDQFCCTESEIQANAELGKLMIDWATAPILEKYRSMLGG